MKMIKKVFAPYFTMLIVGLSAFIVPVLFTAIFEEISGESKDWIWTFVSPASMCFGGFLCSYCVNKKYGISMKNHFKLPSLKIVFLIIFTSMAYMASTFLLVYGKMIDETDYVELTPLVFIEIISACIFAPLSEELIFRYAMLTSIEKSVERRKAPMIVAVFLVNATWTAIHFSEHISRNIDIMVTGIIITTIYFLSRNIICCMIYHGVCNLFAVIFATYYEYLENNRFILYFTILLFFIFFICLCFTLKKIQRKGE